MASTEAAKNPLWNKPAEGISYYTPAQDPPAGSFVEAYDGKPTPKVFSPIKLRGLSLQNRVMLSPLCQYSAEDGHYTWWHYTHMGGIIQRGPGITTVEATAVTPEGRITPEDSGLWKDSQAKELAKVVEFAHSQNQKIMIQLAHAGRKASTVAPWISGRATATEDIGGWPNNVLAPSAIPYSDTFPKPREMTKQDIEDFKAAFVAAVKRAVSAGFDAIEIHNAHGYLLHEFLSGVSNRRTDEYGGSFENRVRLTLETVELARGAMPKDMPLFLRISATDWLDSNEDPELRDRSWKLEDTIRLAPMLAERGVDLLDVSSGGIHPQQKITTKGPRAYQSSLANAIKKVVGDTLPVGVVGAITDGPQAEELLQGGLDLVIVGRAFQKNPGLLFTWADQLDVKIQMPNQIRWAFAGRAS